MADLQTITKLRERTGAGMMDCKKALDEAHDDMELAIEILRKKGESKAAKKADREATEGLIASSENDQNIAIVALACETDFVAKNEDFIASVQKYADKLLEMNDEQAFRTFADEDVKRELVVKIGENIHILQAKLFVKTDKFVGSYIHLNKKIAAVVVLSGGSVEVARDIAMHISAMQPDYLKPEDVPADVLAKEKEIYKEQLRAENKPADMIDKIIEGKINKFYEEVCLMKQFFIKDDKKKIEQLLSENSAQIETYQLVKI
jgi:elongation factor Ts